MARTRTVEAPARSDVYFGMVVCSFVAMLVAIGFLVAEMTFTYDWQSTPPAIAAPSLPAKPARTAASTPAPGGMSLAPVQASKPAVALKPEETPAPQTEAVPAPPAPIPSALTAKPEPTPTVPTAPATETPKPTPTSSGPTPGFQFPKR